MESDDENLVIEQQQLNVSDESLPGVDVGFAGGGGGAGGAGGGGGGGGGGELGLEEEEEVESLAGGAGCQGQEQARRAAIRLLETICTCTATTCQHTALSVWHGWAK